MHPPIDAINYHLMNLSEYPAKEVKTIKKYPKWYTIKCKIKHCVLAKKKQNGQMLQMFQINLSNNQLKKPKMVIRQQTSDKQMPIGPVNATVSDKW